ncbi:hypothetical protein [Xanthomonas translucens]|uniref:hypothetical protein n=1 Tax=Xanthomonas campestris pv. translucens TaxID=343 RepID=UPI00071E7377|nr:hypothetical protein [Xanthomonas translucens]QEO25552.1 hypothetical protein F0H32_04480 [Xanthomonas translucens pv. undulosa]WLA01567.1 hypothetical protein MO330_03020 [Xanthomonas translucens]WLA08431.1 hypothetical protein MO328_19205 [Xanthomonas translucens]
MLELDARQEALLRLPDPFDLLPRLAAEIRRDMPQLVSGISEQELLAETDHCYLYASHELGITCLPVLVRWTKADVGSGGELHRNMDIDLAMRHAADPNLKAADLLGAIASMNRWPKETP